MRLLKSTRLIPRLGSEETRVHAPQLRDHTKLSGGRKLRHELKFIINEGTYLMLRARLAPLMTVDSHGLNGEYRVTSLYFDDVYNSAYWQKVNGIETRRKFRIRAYDLDPSLITRNPSTRTPPTFQSSPGGLPMNNTGRCFPATAASWRTATATRIPSGNSTAPTCSPSCARG